MSDETKQALGRFHFGALGIPVRVSKDVPVDMVVLVRNGEILRQAVLNINTLADQEREIADLKAQLAKAEREAFMRAAQEVRSFLADEPLEAFTRLPEAIESLADRDWRSEGES